MCPGKHQDCNPRTHDALACVRIRQARITVHTDFLTQTWPRCVAAVTVNPGAPACARIHRDCTTETLDALACNGIHQTCIPTTQDALACVSMTQDSIRADAKRHFFLFFFKADKR